MNTTQITEEMIFQCFAAAKTEVKMEDSAQSFVDVEEYENAVMYPEFARWAKSAGYPEIANLFLKVAGEEKAHATWLRALYNKMGTPKRGEDTARAIDALQTIRENCDKLLAANPNGVVEKALKVAIRVENREHRDIYPRFKEQALAENNTEAADVYDRVIQSERQHAAWFEAALEKMQASVPAIAHA